MFCKFCGKEINENAYICVHCGAKVKEDILANGLPTGKSGKSKIVAGLFGILLGGIGVHHFYMGNTGLGIVDILFCWTGIPGILGLINGIIYMTESDDKFESRLNKN